MWRRGVAAGAGVTAGFFCGHRHREHQRIARVHDLVETHWFGREPGVVVTMDRGYCGRTDPIYPFARPTIQAPLSTKFSMKSTGTAENHTRGWLQDLYYYESAELGAIATPTTYQTVRHAFERAKAADATVHCLVTEAQRDALLRLGASSSLAFSIDPAPLEATLNRVVMKKSPARVLDLRRADPVDVSRAAWEHPPSAPWPTLVTDCAVPGVEVATALVRSGVSKMVVVGDDPATQRTVRELTAAAAELDPAALEVVHVTDIDPDALDAEYPELVIRKITQEETVALLTDPHLRTAFVSAGDERPFAAPGGSYHMRVDHGDTPHVEQAMNTLAVRLERQGVETVIFACDHSNSRGPYAAKMFREALRRAAWRSDTRIVVMYPGLMRWNLETAPATDYSPSEYTRAEGWRWA